MSIEKAKKSYTYTPSTDKITYFTEDNPVGEVAARILVDLKLSPKEYGEIYIWKVIPPQETV